MIDEYENDFRKVDIVCQKIIPKYLTCEKT